MAKFSHVQFPNGDIHDVVGTDVVDQQSIKSGSLVNFSTNVALPLTALSSTIVAQQAGTGTPSPSNPRSISGVSSVGLTHCGKNLCPILASQTVNGVQVVASSDGTLTFNRVSASNLSADFTINVSLPNGQYVISANNTSIPPEGSVRSNTFFRPYDGNGTSISVRTFDTVNTKYSFTNSVSKIMIRIDKDFNESNFVLKMQLEQGSTATAYEPYNAETKTIALGQTVYGGVLDAINGKLTITHQIVDLGKKTWLYNETRHYFTTLVSGIKRPLSTVVATGGISSIFVPASAYNVVSEIDDNEFAVSSSSDTLMIRCTTYTDKDTFKTAMHTANAQLVYELATPVEIDITANNFTTIAGVNNIFSDSGEVTVKYFAGTNVNKAIDDISKININAHHDTLVNLTDTAISSPSNSQIVKYNGTKWVNADNSASGVALSGSTMQIQNTTVQKFLDVLYDALKDTTVELTASGSIANFTTSLALPLVAMSAEIVAQQASGTPTPSSPLPITGVSSIGLTQTGKNIFSSSIVQGALYASGSESSTTTTRVKTDDYIICKSNTQYVVSFNSGIIPVSAVYYDKNKVYISGETLTGPTFTTPLNCAYVRFGIAKTNTTQNITPSDVTQTQLEEGSTATAYEPYNAETKTIALGQTVYGGVLDAINGKATITRIGYNLKDYTGSITKVGSGSSTYFRFDDLTPYPDTRTGYFMISDKYEKAVITTTTTAVGISAGTPSTLDHTTIFFRPENPDTYTTTTIMDYIINTLGGVQVVYDLATPQEITGLTPANFTTFAGEQNIFSDSGDISVSFKQGIQEYIDAKIAETQA